MAGLSADDLYELVDIKHSGTTLWEQDLPAKQGGVYVITVDPTKVRFVDLSDNAVCSRWIIDESVIEIERERRNCSESIVYIGRATNLSKRLKQFQGHIYGKRSPHCGGQAILLLDSPKTIHWAVGEDFVAIEHKLDRGVSWPCGTNAVRQ